MTPPELFLNAYETALATQRWANVALLIHPLARITFSDGTVLNGTEEIKAAYERNFALIKNEDYRLTNVRWLSVAATLATYTFDFNWQGTINGQTAVGSGKGKGTLVFEDGRWHLLEETLSKV